MHSRILLAVALCATTSSVAGQSGRGFIAGRVVDALTGKPVPAAVVTIDGTARPVALASRSEPGFLTDTQGRFIFDNLPPGTFSLHVEKNGFVYAAYGQRRPQGSSVLIDLPLDGRILDADIRVWRLSSLAGQVVDETGQPIVGAMVTAFRRSFVGGRPMLVATSPVNTDDRGAYYCGGLLPGSYIVGVTFRLATASAAAIAPNASASMRFNGLALSSQSGPFVRVVDGRVFSMANTYAPSAASSDRATVIDMPSGGERSGVDIRVRSAPLVAVSGVAMTPSAPAAGLVVRLAPSDGAQFLGVDLVTQIQATADADGRFTILAAPGQYDLGTPATGTPASLVGSMPLSVGDAGVSNVTLQVRPKHALTGRIEFDGGSQRPASRQIRLSLEPGDGRGARPALNAADDSTLRSTAIGPGRYLVRLLTGPLASNFPQPGGWYLKSAMLNGKDVADEPFVMGDDDLSGLVVTLTDHPSTVSGTVRNAQGDLDATMTVAIFPVDRTGWLDFGGSPRRLASVRVDRRGAFLLRGLPAGDYFAVAVPDELTANWQNPAWLQTASRFATKLHVEDGTVSSIELRTSRW